MKIASAAALGFVIFALTACGGGGGGANAPVTNPVQPAPSAPAEVAPPTRTAITLQSDAGDVIGQGANYAYANTNATITVVARNNLLSVTVGGDQDWTAEFQTGGTATELKPGMYADLDAYVPSAGTTRPGLRWYGEGRGCGTSKGWFAIDSVTYAAGSLKAISLRFERHCDGASPALHGVVEYSVDDKSAPPEVAPIPADLWRPPANTGAGGGNYVYLESNAGDYVGQGKTYRYDINNSEIWSNAAFNFIGVTVNGDEQWTGVFMAMRSLADLKVGYYPQLRAYPFNNPTRGGIDWTGDGRGCSSIDGWFAVDAMTVENGKITAYDLRFEQRCEGRAAPLRGAVHWRADPAVPTASIANSPAGSWQPPAAAASTAGNYLYLEGDPGGLPTNRQLHLFNNTNATIAANADGQGLSVLVEAASHWQGDIQLDGTGVQLAPGLYSGLPRFFYSGQPTPAMSWTGEHRSCAGSHGWLAIDSVAYVNGQLSAIDLRFEQVCDGAPLPMHGVLHWRASGVVPAPGPSAVMPDMWRPPAAALPASGNYVYLASDRSDFIGAGLNYLYTPSDASLKITATEGAVLLNVDGDQRWAMNFATMSGHARLERGYYGALARHPFHNKARGGFDWGGDGRGCNASESGVIIDNVTYDNGVLTALEMRFEQHCENRNGALRGAIRWAATDQTKPPGPVSPIPASLWQAPAAALPVSGNYVYLQSDAGDFIGSDPTTIAKTPSLPVTVSASGNRLNIEVAGDVNGRSLWSGAFVTMSSINQIQPGLYNRLMGQSIFNPARGSFGWSGDGRGCNTSLSWFAIDKVIYSNGQLTALDARFEQHCDSQAPALRGVIHWMK